VSGKTTGGKDAQGHQTTHGYAGVPGLFVSYGQSPPDATDALSALNFPPPAADSAVRRAQRSRL